MQKRMLAPAVALVALLSACTAHAPAPTHTPAPTATPVFATDAAALAAAEDAYAKYQAMEDTISHEGGKDPDRIRPFAARGALEDALSGYAQYSDTGLHSTGSVSFDNFQVKNYFPNAANGINAVVVDGCLDVSKVDVVDQAGASKVPSGRVGRQTFRLKFDLVGSHLLLASREHIESESLCA